MSLLLPAARKLVPALGVGVALGLIEAAVAGSTRPELFLSLREFVRFAAIASCLAVSLQLMLGSVIGVVAHVLTRRASEREELVVTLLTGLATAPAAVWLFWLLSEGRRLRSWQLRPLAVSGAALVCAALAMLLALSLWRLAQASLPRQRAGFIALLLMAAACLGVDQLVLVRLYPAFHIGLSATATLLGAASALLWPFALPRRMRIVRILCGIAVAAGLGGPFWLRATEAAPNLHYAIHEAAPLSSKLQALLRPRLAAVSGKVDAAAVRAPVSVTPGISLRGDDILLITIDALRADRLRTYGSHRDVTPELDRLASQSVVFDRAYTQTPHTSYALGSLFTGKYLRPVLSLPGKVQKHATLARSLRRYGYRTAAFYPPAVFFVDEDRFGDLARDHFGFEYVKEMFAPAASRVEQLREYLNSAAPGHPLFVWVHLFEPHEPYDPAPGFERGDEPEQRYDGEVAAADAAVGALVRVFRNRKPDATVIVSADHGEEFSDHGGHYHGTTLFDEQVRVPLLWSSPGRTPPHRVHSAVQLADLAPTLLSALGVPRDARMRGSDLTGLLAGGPENPALRAFASIDELRMWTDGKHKLICEASQGACRLYDLIADPSESSSISDAEPQLQARFASELSSLVASIPDVEAQSMASGDAWPEALARARLGDASAGPELLPLLGDDRPAVRAETLQACANLRLMAALPIATTLAERDPEQAVREEAALAALTLGDDRWLAAVRGVLLRARPEPAADGGGASSSVLARQPPAGGNMGSDRQLSSSADKAASDRALQPTAAAQRGDAGTDPSAADALDRARRAAFALAAVTPDAEVANVLVRMAADGDVVLSERERALAALGGAHQANVSDALLTLLDDVRLRPAVARTLGQLGGPGVRPALLRALAHERYAEARAAESDALVELHEPRARSLMLRFLGTETGLPGGLEQWANVAGPQRGARGHLYDLRQSNRDNPLQGTWNCHPTEPDGQPAGCSPTRGAALRMTHVPSLRGQARALLQVWSTGATQSLRVGPEEFALRRGRNELSFAVQIDRPALLRWPVRSNPSVTIELVGIVPRQPDIPSPPPEEPLAEPTPGSDGGSSAHAG
jgi:arylsulfatase A-like enzyme